MQARTHAHTHTHTHTHSLTHTHAQRDIRSATTMGAVAKNTHSLTLTHTHTHAQKDTKTQGQPQQWAQRPKTTYTTDGLCQVSPLTAVAHVAPQWF